MKWKQFFTPVKSMNAGEVKSYIKSQPRESYTIVDVRQPSEYEAGHIPDAVLIPVSQLDSKIGELDKNKTAVVYCAVGGRSRVAAQMLAGKGFEKVINVAGGYKAWQGKSAFGGEDAGLEYFRGDESLEEVLKVSYFLEKGLHDFYQKMMEKVDQQEVADLFSRLSQIEIQHRKRVLSEYGRVTGKTPDPESFETKTGPEVVEGGLTTQQYIDMFNPDFSNPGEVLELAMSIEAQAMDMYSRAAARSENRGSGDFLDRMAGEEKAHLSQLGDLIDNLNKRE
ncbi:MAG: rhodanese-like domain-containing protein [Desulfobacteraceae bacterium]